MRRLKWTLSDLRGPAVAITSGPCFGLGRIWTGDGAGVLPVVVSPNWSVAVTAMVYSPLGSFLEVMVQEPSLPACVWPTMA